MANPHRMIDQTAEQSSLATGVLGGTFDPPHLGHLAIAEAARLRFCLDTVLFVPARLQPHKLDRPVTDAGDRWAMLLLAIGRHPHFTASRLELDRDGPSFTADTLLMLRARLGPAARLRFICGADVLMELTTWHRPDVVLACADLAVARRPGLERDDVLLAVAAELTSRYGGVIDLFDAPLVDVSSTLVRARAAAGLSLRRLVPDAVREYIDQHGLYSQGSIQSC